MAGAVSRFQAQAEAGWFLITGANSVNVSQDPLSTRHTPLAQAQQSTFPELRQAIRFTYQLTFAGYG